MSRFNLQKSFYVAIALTVMAFMFSCVSVKKQRFRAESFYREHPEELAVICATNFPPTYKQGKEIELRRDTVYMPGDTVECPPVVDKQTGKVTPGAKIPCKPGKTIYIPRIRVDTTESPALLAKNAALKQENADLRASLKERDKSLKAAEGTAKDRLWTIVGLGAALIVAAIVIIKKVF